MLMRTNKNNIKTENTSLFINIIVVSIIICWSLHTANKTRFDSMR